MREGERREGIVGRWEEVREGRKRGKVGRMKE